MRFVSAFAVFNAVLVAQVKAIELHVPLQYPTIQAAANASADGDTIVLAPGIYTGPGNKNIHFPHLNGQSVQIASANPQVSSVVAATVIDAEGQGRAFEVHNIHITISGITFRNAYTDYGYTASGAGGAIYAQNSKAVLKSCVFSSNFSDYYGGALGSRHSSWDIADCVFRSNTSPLCGGAAYFEDSSADFLRCSFEQNYTTDDSFSPGGAIAGKAKELEPGLLQFQFKQCRFASNHSPSKAGAIFLTLVGSVLVEQCIFEGNSATLEAGAMHVWGCSLDILNSQFTSNIAPESSAIAFEGIIDHCSSRSAKLWNATVTDNVGKNAPISIFGDFSVAHSIIWNQLETDTEVVVRSVPGYVHDVHIAYSNIEGNVEAVQLVGGGSLSWGSGNLNVSPRFMSPSTGDYHLSPDSALVNAGDPAFVGGGFDIDGEPRVREDRIDIGADETGLVLEPVQRGIVGADNSIQVRGGAGNSLIYLLIGLERGEMTMSTCSFLPVGLNSIDMVLGTFTDYTGNADWSSFVEHGTKGQLHLQAVEPATCRISNVVSVGF